MIVFGLLADHSLATLWLGGNSGDDWNDENNWDGGLLPDVGFVESAEIGSGDNPQIIADLVTNPRHILVDGGTIDHSAGLVSLTNGGLNLGEDVEDLGPVHSEYNLTGGELRVDAANFTDVNVGVRVDSGTSALNISGTGFLNQVGVSAASRGVKVGRQDVGVLSMTDSARLYTAGQLRNGGDLPTGFGTISIFGSNVQIDADLGYTTDAVSILDFHIDATGVSPINTLADAILDGFLQVDFSVTPTNGDMFPLINTGTGVTGTFLGGVSATGLAIGQTVSVDYAGGDGNDVVLNVVGAGLPGDFDGDGDVDGLDFLEWQLSDQTPAGLAAWEANYPTPLSALSAPVSSVPEPSTGLLMVCVMWATLVARKGQKRGLARVL